MDSEDIVSQDIVILGGGMAGLTLARQLLLETEHRITVLDKRECLPGHRQKVGESSVQVGGYYLSKILDLEESLSRDHFMKYNLRFYWKSAGCRNDGLEDYSQTYIRPFSNVPSYNIDRNRLEEHLLALNAEADNYRLLNGISDLSVNLAPDDSQHEVRFKHDGAEQVISADWVVDCTGRGQFLSRRDNVEKSDPIQHSSAFMWVDGLVDIEKLTRQTRRQSRLSRDRQKTGHLPFWAATNHFMGEGFWLWVIPLGSGMTSLGVVYDTKVFDASTFSSVDKLRKWICEEFPLFKRDLPNRTVVDFNAIRSFSYGCPQTISVDRWAMSGMSGRFTDPLYSPGSDFIALHNMQIVAAIKTSDRNQLARKCRFFEMLSQSLHESLLPTYSVSYNALGDAETFALKYTWELSVYFSFFVFPFINDLEIDTEFIPTYLSRFSRLGKINHSLQKFISDYFDWKTENVPNATEPAFHELLEMPGLQDAEATFYEVGITSNEAKAVLSRQLLSLDNLARFMVSWICSQVTGQTTPLTDPAFGRDIDFTALVFDVERIAACVACYSSNEELCWPEETEALRKFGYSLVALSSDSTIA